MSKSKSALQVGNNVLIRGVALYYLGHIEEIHDKEIVLSKAAWIPNTGRFHEALRDGAAKLEEIEPYPDGVTVERGAISDTSIWKHELPTKAK